jgi:hypothetical protein
MLRLLLESGLLITFSSVIDHPANGEPLHEHVELPADVADSPVDPNLKPAFPLIRASIVPKVARNT